MTFRFISFLDAFLADRSMATIINKKTVSSRKNTIELQFIQSRVIPSYPASCLALVPLIMNMHMSMERPIMANIPRYLISFIYFATSHFVNSFALFLTKNVLTVRIAAYLRLMIMKRIKLTSSQPNADTFTRLEKRINVSKMEIKTSVSSFGLLMTDL